MAENRYDSDDIVRRHAVLLAGPLKWAAYKVRDVVTGDWSSYQFHETWDNTVITTLPESVARHFILFVQNTIDGGFDDLPGGLAKYDLDGLRFRVFRRAPKADGAPGEITYTLFYRDIVLGVMGGESAKLFCRMAESVLNPEKAESIGVGEG
jgi:hypothetical protein